MLLSRRNQLQCLALGAVMLTTAASGCSQKIVPVSGVVNIDGAPAGNIYVTFFPVSDKGRPAHGTTDESGRFKLTTKNPDDGAFVGEYKVTFAIESTMPTIVRPGAGAEPDKRIMDEAEMRKMREGGRRGSPGQRDTKSNLLHPNYKDVAKTPITLKVPPSGQVTFNLNKDGT